MAKKVRVKMSSAGSRKVLNSSEVQADLRRRADAIAMAAGEGYWPSVQAGVNRARASVITADFKAIRDNAKNNTLLKSLDKGR